jgi:predicted PP-loop superfamily ATPase
VTGTCIKIGSTKQEVGIKIGDKFLVYGKAVLDLQNMTVKFNFPTALVKSKSDYLSMIQSYGYFFKLIAFLFGFAATIEIFNSIRSLVTKRA